MYNTNSLDVYV